jgi:hypothetical protein
MAAWPGSPLPVREFDMTARVLSQNPERDDAVGPAQIKRVHLHGVDTYWVPGLGVAVVGDEADPDQALRGLQELMIEHDLLSGELLFPATGKIPKSLMSHRGRLANHRISVTRATMANLEASARQILTAFWRDSHAATQHLLGY